MVDKAREVALKTLYRIHQEGAYSHIVLNEMLMQNRENLKNIDVSLISEIVYGVTTWKLTLDEIIKKYSKIRLKKISPWILNILRMSIYQIVFLDKIPKSAAVNEGVNLAKRYGHKSSAGFVNAILRKVSKKDYEEMFEIKDKKERISKTTSMPIWIIEELLKDGHTIEQIKEICECSCLRPKISIRVNRLKTNKQELKEKLQKQGIEIEEGILEDFLILKKIKEIENLKEFKEGLFTVQDEVAGLTALILDAKPNEIIMDSCSSPGGKTSYIAEKMQNKGTIIACDIHKHRTKLVEQTAKRLGIDIIQTQIQDATKFQEEYQEKFDKILLDVPCLGIGVLKRKPDIKWQRKPENKKEITKIQYDILTNCSKYLKPNGEMVYSTCSILKEENEKLIKKFLEKNKDMQVQKIELTKQNGKKYFEKYKVNESFLQVFQNQKTDGFFICKLAKK